MPQNHVIVAGRFVLRALYRKRGCWQARVRDLQTGRVFAKSSPLAGKAVARVAIVKYLEDLAKRDAHEPRRRPFLVAFEEWIETRTCRPVTVSIYRRMLSALGPAFEHLYLDQIQLADVEKFMVERAKLRRLGKNGEDLGPRNSAHTIAKWVGTLRALCRWGRRRGYCQGDPTEGIRLVQSRKDVGRALSEDEARALVKETRGHLRLSVLLALYTGLRSRNVHEMTWRHLDLDARRVSFEAHETKGRTSLAVPLHKVVVAALREERDRRKVFSLDDRVIPVDQFRRSWGSTVKRVGIGHVRFHDLRHTFTSWISSRCSYACVQALLGHASGSVTLRYSHVTWAEKLAAVDSLPDVTISPVEEAGRRSTERS